MVDVFAMFVHVFPPSVEEDHFTTYPVFPVKVNVPLLEPVHTEVDPVRVPATGGESMVMVAVEEFAAGKIPFTTEALYRITFGGEGRIRFV